MAREDIVSSNKKTAMDDNLSPGRFLTPSMAAIQVESWLSSAARLVAPAGASQPLAVINRHAKTTRNSVQLTGQVPSSSSLSLSTNLALLRDAKAVAEVVVREEGRYAIVMAG
jgi:hypothetical protein